MDKIEVINLVEYAVLDITDHRMCNIYHLFWWSDTIKGMEISYMLQNFFILVFPFDLNGFLYFCFYILSIIKWEIPF